MDSVDHSRRELAGIPLPLAIPDEGDRDRPRDHRTHHLRPWRGGLYCHTCSRRLDERETAVVEGRLSPLALLSADELKDLIHRKVEADPEIQRLLEARAENAARTAFGEGGQVCEECVAADGSESRPAVAPWPDHPDVWLCAGHLIGLGREIKRSEREGAGGDARCCRTAPVGGGGTAC